MADEIFDALDLSGISTPGNSPSRFQVLVRVEKNLPQQALNGMANAHGGKIDQLLVSENSALAEGKGSVFVLSFPDTPARDNIIAALAKRPCIEVAGSGGHRPTARASHNCLKTGEYKAEHHH